MWTTSKLPPNKALQTDKGGLSCLLHTQKPRQPAFAAELGCYTSWSIVGGSPEMSETLKAIKGLAAAGEVRISEHGYDELAEDRIGARDIIGGLADAVVVEAYPEFPKGPAVLVLQYDHTNAPIHVVWGHTERALQPSGVGDSV